MTFFQLQSPEGSIYLKTKRRLTEWRALEITICLCGNKANATRRRNVATTSASGTLSKTCFVTATVADD